MAEQAAWHRAEEEALRPLRRPEEAAARAAKAMEVKAAKEARAAKAREEAEHETLWAVKQTWGERTLLFHVIDRVLPMHIDSESATPHEVAQVWESWGVAYAARLRFAAQPGQDAKFLNMREDTLPSPPAATRLEGKTSILQAVALALTQRDAEAQARAEVGGAQRRKRADHHGGKWMRMEEGFRWQAPVPQGTRRLDDSRGVWPPMR